MTENEDSVEIDWQGALAIYGGVLGTALAVLRISEYFRDRPKIRVAFEPNALSTLEGDPGWYCHITVVNSGRRPVTIQALGLQFIDGRTGYPGLAMYSPGLPATLDESEQVSGFMRREEVDLSKVHRAFARGSDGKMYRSAKYRHRTSSS